MVQNNNKYRSARPDNRSATKAGAENKSYSYSNNHSNRNVRHPSCKQNVGAILTFIGALIISASILFLADAVRNIGVQPARPTKENKSLDMQITNFIEKNPKLIADSVNNYYRKQQEDARKAAAPRVADKAIVKEILKDKTNHVLGNPKAPFVIIEFFDYNCGYCKRMNKALGDAIKKTNAIRWVVMDTPIFGEKSELIARYAWAAAKQGKYAEYHAALGEAQDKSEAGLKKIGKQLKLNVDRLAKDAHSKAAKAKMEANQKYAQKLQLSGVPLFIINGQIQPGAFGPDVLEKHIKTAEAMLKTKKK